jgi:hypothetical protein
VSVLAESIQKVRLCYHVPLVSSRRSRCLLLLLGLFLLLGLVLFLDLVLLLELFGGSRVKLHLIIIDLVIVIVAVVVVSSVGDRRLLALDAVLGALPGGGSRLAGSRLGLGRAGGRSGFGGGDDFLRAAGFEILEDGLGEVLPEILVRLVCSPVA